MADIGHNSHVISADIINFRREIWLSNKTIHAKIIALAIVEHMTTTGLQAHPGKKRLARLCSISEDTLDRHFKEAIIFFDVKERPGRTSLFHAKITKTVEEIFALWEDRARTQSNIKRTASELKVVAGTEYTTQQHTPPQDAHPQDAVGLAANPPAGCTPPQDNPPAKQVPTPPQDAPPKSLEEGRIPMRARESGCKEYDTINLVAATAIGVAAAISPMAVAAKPEPPRMERPASPDLPSCWQTSRAQMAAVLNPSEGAAQRQIWVTDSGRVCVGEQFKTELAEAFPLVDLTSGLAAASPNVNLDHGALTAQKHVLRQFGYMQQDAKRRAEMAAARSKDVTPPRGQTQHAAKKTAKPIDLLDGFVKPAWETDVW